MVGKRNVPCQEYTAGRNVEEKWTSGKTIKATKFLALTTVSC